MKGLTWERAKALAAASRQPGMLEVSARRDLLSRRVSLSLPGHDLLANHADWNAPVWAMEPEGLEQLASTLLWLHERLDLDLEFFAVWPPDDIEAIVELSIDELVSLIRASMIGTRSVYRVAAAQPK